MPKRQNKHYTKYKICSTGKRRYHSELDAKLALASAMRRDKGERRVYHHPLCGGWHITSQSKKTPTEIDKSSS
jgi:hypothetical protein